MPVVDGTSSFTAQVRRHSLSESSCESNPKASVALSAADNEMKGKVSTGSAGFISTVLRWSRSARWALSQQRLRSQAVLLGCLAFVVVVTFQAGKPSGVQKPSGADQRRMLFHKQDGVEYPVALGSQGDISLTIFCSPKPYMDDDPDDPQRRALSSWLRLRPKPKIVLMGRDPSLYRIAKEYPDWVSVEPNLDYSFLGMPLFHSMVARARAADTAVSMLINGDIILLQNVFPTMAKVAATFNYWILTAARWDLEEIPFRFQQEKLSHLDGTVAQDEDVDRYARDVGMLHTYGGVDFWAWNNGPKNLHHLHMPPFSFGRGRYDNWFTHEIVQGPRQVVDASDAVTSIHVKHAYTHVGKTGAKADEVSGVNFWTQNKKNSWEAFANVRLSQEVNTNYTNQKGTALHIPWKMVRCHEPGNREQCISLLKRERPATCNCEYSNFVKAAQTDPKLDGRAWRCGVVSTDKEYVIQTIAKKDSPPGLPHTMEQLLPAVADENKVVVLVGVTVGYKDMLMNFICRLRRFGISNLLVAALDEDLYKWAFTQGLPVYYETSAGMYTNVSESNCVFGSQCFRAFTKVKSRAVLRVLRAGYNVLWTDVDIVWFKNVIPDMMAYGAGTLPIQSNEPNDTAPDNGIRRINSGFYYARSDDMTIKAFEAIVKHAMGTRLSEQPSFYDILCGEKGEKRTGDSTCLYDNGLKVIFLSRLKYPNGATGKIWEASNVEGECQKRGCLVLHNNWIAGRDAKLERMMNNSFWHYDPEERMCIHEWHSKAFGNKKVVIPSG